MYYNFGNIYVKANGFKEAKMQATEISDEYIYFKSTDVKKVTNREVKNIKKMYLEEAERIFKNMYPGNIMEKSEDSIIVIINEYMAFEAEFGDYTDGIFMTGISYIHGDRYQKIFDTEGKFLDENIEGDGAEISPDKAEEEIKQFISQYDEKIFWKDFFEKFNKYGKLIIDEPVEKHKLFSGSEYTLIQKDYLNNMYPDEYLFLYIDPERNANWETAKYYDRFSHHWYCWLDEVVSHIEDTEYIVKAMIQFMAMSLPRYKENALMHLLNLSIESIGQVHYGSYNKTYFYDDYGYGDSAAHRMSLCKSGIEKMTEDEKIKYIHDYIQSIFNDYRIVRLTEGEYKPYDFDEIKMVRNLTDYYSRYRDAKERADFVGPESITDFTGEVTLNCEIHGEYTVNVIKERLIPGCKLCALAKEEMKRKEEARAREVKIENERENRAQQFIEEATRKYGGFYDYKYVLEDFVNVRTPVRIVHPDLGVFYHTPKNHLLCRTGYPEFRTDIRLPSAKEIEKKDTFKGKDGCELKIGQKVKWEDRDSVVVHYGKITRASSRFFYIRGKDGEEYKKGREAVEAA